jgi:hypothetical protein
MINDEPKINDEQKEKIHELKKKFFPNLTKKF